MSILGAIILGAAVGTNSTFQSVMPRISADAQKMAIPVGLPIMATDISKFSCTDESKSGILELTNGLEIGFFWGAITWFSRADTRIENLRDRRNVPGQIEDRPCRLALGEAEQRARSFALRTGLSEAQLNLNVPPKVEQPRPPGWPFFTFTWSRPQVEDETLIEVMVDARDGSIGSARCPILLKQLVAEFTRHAAEPLVVEVEAQQIPPEDLRQSLMKKIATSMASWADRLGISADNLAPAAIEKAARWYESRRNGNANGWATHLVYTNGWVLTFVNGNLRGWDAPDRFFDDEKDIDHTHFQGEWRMSEGEAKNFARTALSDLGFKGPEFEFLVRNPKVSRANVSSQLVIPRLLLTWVEVTEGILRTEVTVEVDADSKRICHLKVFRWQQGMPRVIIQ